MPAVPRWGWSVAFLSNLPPKNRGIFWVWNQKTSPRLDGTPTKIHIPKTGSSLWFSLVVKTLRILEESGTHRNPPQKNHGIHPLVTPKGSTKLQGSKAVWWVMLVPWRIWGIRLKHTPNESCFFGKVDDESCKKSHHVGNVHNIRGWRFTCHFYETPKLETQTWDEFMSNCRSRTCGKFRPFEISIYIIPLWEGYDNSFTSIWEVLKSHLFLFSESFLICKKSWGVERSGNFELLVGMSRFRAHFHYFWELPIEGRTLTKGML